MCFKSETIENTPCWFGDLGRWNGPKVRKWDYIRWSISVGIDRLGLRTCFHVMWLASSKRLFPENFSNVISPLNSLSGSSVGKLKLSKAVITQICETLLEDTWPHSHIWTFCHHEVKVMLAVNFFCHDRSLQFLLICCSPQHQKGPLDIVIMENWFNLPCYQWGAGGSLDTAILQHLCFFHEYRHQWMCSHACCISL